MSQQKTQTVTCSHCGAVNEALGFTPRTCGMCGKPLASSVSLYRAAIAADEAYSAALVAAYGHLRACAMRYSTKHTDAAVIAALKSKLEADTVWLAAMQCGETRVVAPQELERWRDATYRGK
jgi:predicted amidophosphoribosyltransferase